MAMQRPPIFEEEEIRETFLQRWTRKAKNQPFLAAGLFGLVGMCGLGISKYKYLRSTGMSTSLFLIQLRVAAQGMVAGSLAIALFKDTITELLQGDQKKSDES